MIYEGTYIKVRCAICGYTMYVEEKKFYEECGERLVFLQPCPRCGNIHDELLMVGNNGNFWWNEAMNEKRIG